MVSISGWYPVKVYTLVLVQKHSCTWQHVPNIRMVVYMAFPNPLNLKDARIKRLGEFLPLRWEMLLE